MWGLGSSIILNTDGDHNFISSLYQRKQIIIWDDSLHPNYRQFWCSFFVFCLCFLFFGKMPIFMSYLWVKKENELFLNGKGIQIQKFCIFWRYTQFIYFHQILMYIFRCIDCDKGFRFPLSVMVFELKLDCSKTGAGGRCSLLAVVITWCAQCSPLLMILITSKFTPKNDFCWINSSLIFSAIY
jgi:hypothetical protein